MRVNRSFAFCFLAALSAAQPGVAVTTSFGGGAFTMEFVDITGGTTADDTGFGAVPYDYRMGKHEVTRAMVDAYNASGGGPFIEMFDYEAFGVSGGNRPDRPATGVIWNHAARFVNWLNVSSGFAPAYKFTSILGADDNITLWTAGEAGFNPANPFRNSYAFYFLPSEDEWYRAAYYDPVRGSYWDYATGSDAPPRPVRAGTRAGTAVYNHVSDTGPADVTNAGGLSPFGTMAQNGNAAEWAESGSSPPNDFPGEPRVRRGGDWQMPPIGDLLISSSRDSLPPGPAFRSSDLGFRVAALPEPSTVVLVLLGCWGVMGRRRRGLIRCDSCPCRVVGQAGQ